MKFVFGDLPAVFRFFRSMIGMRLYLVILVIAVATATEIVGVSLFLPLLNGGEGNDLISRAIRGFFNFLGLTVRFTTVLWVMIVAMVVRTAMLMARDVLIAASSARITVDLNRRLLNGISRAEFKFFHGLNVGRVNNTVAVEIPQVNVAFEQMAGTIAGMAFAIAYISLAIVMSPILALVMFLVAPVAYLGMSWANRRIRMLSFQITAAAGDHQHWMLHVLQNFRYLRTTGTWNLLDSRVMGVAGKLASIRFRTRVMQAGSTAMLGIFAFLVVALVLLQQVNMAGVAVLDAVFMLFLLKRGFDQILVVQESYRKLLGVIGSVHNYSDLVTGLESQVEAVRTGSKIPDLAGSIEMRDVGVRYKDRGYSLENVSMDIEPGKWVALVGESGAGKSTALAVLTGVIPPDLGVVSIGGTDYHDIALDEFRKRIGYVPQDPAVFDDTILNNLTLWDDRIDRGTIDEALEVAQLVDMVRELPDGLDTVLGPNGTAVSGGQRQRISIARELIRDVDLLILDEATSAVDGPTERKIHRALREKRGSRTTIVVAHRLETIRDCDRIYVLNNGLLIESGSFDELYSAGGELSRLVHSGNTGSPEVIA